MEIDLSVLKNLCNKDIILPVMTTFVGAWLAFKLNALQMRKVQKNEQIANLNYLLAVLYNYSEEMNYLDKIIELKLLALINCHNYYKKYHQLPSNMDEDVLDGFALIFCNKPKTDIVVANYIFTDRDTNFIISIIKALRFIKDVYESIDTSNDMFEKFSCTYCNKVPEVKYYGDFVGIQIKNLKIVQEKVYQASYVIMNCIRIMVEYNNKYLKYKIADIKLSKELLSFIKKSNEIIESKYNFSMASNDLENSK